MYYTHSPDSIIKCTTVQISRRHEPTMIPTYARGRGQDVLHNTVIALKMLISDLSTYRGEGTGVVMVESDLWFQVHSMQCISRLCSTPYLSPHSLLLLGDGCPNLLHPLLGNRGGLCCELGMIACGKNQGRCSHLQSSGV